MGSGFVIEIFVSAVYTLLAVLASGAFVWLALRLAMGATARASFWERRIREFEAADRRAPPPRGVVVFTGSSTINFWDTLDADFAPLPVVNRGFGGSHLAHVAHYAPRIVTPYAPRAVVIYAGENDLSWPTKRAPADVAHDFADVVTAIRAGAPDVPILYLSIKPSPTRRRRQAAFDATNTLIQTWIAMQHGITFVDIRPALSGPDGRPLRAFWRWDGIHLRPSGYAALTRVLRPALERVLGV